MNWFNKKKNDDDFYNEIEQAVQDDLAMFLEFGEEYFSLEELEMMNSQWEKEFNMTDKLRGHFVMLCSGSFMIFPLAGLFLLFGLQEYIPTFFVLFPLFFLLGVAGFVVLYLKYGRLSYQESVGRRLKFAIRNKRIKLGYPKDFTRDS